MALTTRQTALQRLKALPPLIRTQELQRLTGWSPGVVSVMAHRWERAGLIERTGPRGEVLVNRFAADPPDFDLRRAAIARGWMSAVEIGADPIHRVGWTNQIPRLIDLAVLRKPAKHPSYDLGGIGLRLHRRPVKWYEVVQKGLHVEDSLPSLQPAWALADAVLDANLWAPFPDELLAESESPRVAAAFIAAVRAIAVARRLGVADRLPSPEAQGPLVDLYESVWSATRESGESLRTAPRKKQMGRMHC